jgi:hypothetical protein
LVSFLTGFFTSFLTGFFTIFLVLGLFFGAMCFNRGWTA